MNTQTSLVISYFIFLIPILISQTLNAQDMNNIKPATSDLAELSRLNAQFIKNFINEDTAAHNGIIHKEFVCIQSSGVIMERDEYMRGWAKGYSSSGYTSFDFTEEHIRIFGNVALVRSRTVYTKEHDGKVVKGSSIYTDTYVRENRKWLCVQAQITPVK